jgi:hypothetical protein
VTAHLAAQGVPRALAGTASGRSTAGGLAGPS